MRPILGTLLAAAMLTGAAAPALAAGGPLVVESSVLTEQKHAAADGTTRVSLVPARKAVPGDRVVLALAYRNTGAQALSNIVLDNPVPAGIAYRAPAQGSPMPELSVDGRTYGPLTALRVRTNLGGTRAATVDDITHVRWRLAAPLPAGGKGQFSFQAVLK